MDKIIEVKSLHKAFGEVKAVNDISFYVETGKLFAFLGPNGAGKSTTIDIICTLLKADSGEVVVDGKVLGKSDDKIRQVIGAVFQEGVLDKLLTVRENLYARGSFYKMSKSQLKASIDKIAKATGIDEFIDRPYGKLSGGQKRRADVARALINMPKILFLDEPTTGLDPKTRKSIWNMIQDLQKETGMTVFLTTHYMEEAAGADYVIVVDKGEITAKGTPSELKERYASDLLKLSVNDEDKVAALLLENNISYKMQAERFVINIANTMESFHLLELCKDYLTGFEVLNGTMDDAFIEITKGGISNE